MGIVKGGALRALQSFLYLLAFCCSAIILGIFSYFLAILADRDDIIPRDWKAVEGLSGAAVLYTIFATILTCCLGGISFFAFLGIVLDIAFLASMIAIAVMTRNGAYSCSGYVNTPLGMGQSYAHLPNVNKAGNRVVTYSVTLGTACRMEKACFAVSIVAIFLFLLTAIMQVVLVRHHKKEKRFGPSPSNNYTSGYGSKKRKGGLFARKNKKDERDAEVGAVGAGGLAPGHHHDVRPSHETGYTGTTVGGTNGLVHDKVEPNGTHAGYYNQPATTTANPYGYNTTTTTNTTTGTATNY